MPFANFKVPAGTLSAEQKKQIVDTATDLYAERDGEQAGLTPRARRRGPRRRLGIGGTVLTAAMINGD